VVCVINRLVSAVEGMDAPCVPSSRPLTPPAEMYSFSPSG
jgi:hypothetical protein